LLQVLPNTDTALLLALINVIISENLYDHDFVERWCYGFEELSERVRDYPPSFAAKECGVPEEDIIAVARILGTEKPWGMLIGVATDQNPNGCQLVQAICSLAAITGNLDVPGGTVVGAQMQFDMNADSPLSPELVNKCIGWKEYPILPVLLNTTHPDITLECLETDKPYAVKMAWLDSSNLLSPTCSAQPKRWHDALKKMEFAVAKEVFMTPTVMALADIVLPLASWAEHDGVVMTNQGCQMGIIGALNKAFSVGECKSDLEMYIHFGKAFHGESWKVNSVEDYLKNDIGAMGYDWHDLKEKVVGINTIGGYDKYQRGLIRPDGQPGFTTATGRAELWSTGYSRLGDDPLPYYRAPALGATALPEYAEAYPLLLVTGPRHYASFHSEHRQIPSLRALNPDPLVELHPELAAQKNIRSGDRVIIENPWGEAEFRALVTPIIRPDVISCDHGWWFPEEEGAEPSLFGVWKSNVNSMVPHKVIGKMGFGAPYKALCANIRKA
jgi:anaerobic selenocysteine-containing dehydrogenase